MQGGEYQHNINSAILSFNPEIQISHRSKGRKRENVKLLYLSQVSDLCVCVCVPGGGSHEGQGGHPVHVHAAAVAETVAHAVYRHPATVTH